MIDRTESQVKPTSGIGSEWAGISKMVANHMAGDKFQAHPPELLAEEARDRAAKGEGAGPQTEYYGGRKKSQQPGKEEEEEQKRREEKGLGQGGIQGGGGIDTLDVLCWVDFPEDHRYVCERLEEARECGLENPDDPHRMEELAGHLFEVQPFMGVCQLVRGYVLKSCGITVTITKARSGEAQLANLRYYIGSEMLMVHGLAESVRRAERIIKALGGRKVKESIVRADPAVDVPHVKVSEFTSAFMRNLVVRQSRQWRLMGEGEFGDQSGIYFGSRKSDAMCRIYDKLNQAKAEGNQVKLYCLRERWGCDPEDASRIEFELSGKFLKELGVFTTADLIEKQGEVLAHLTENWLVFCSKKPKGNTARKVVSDLWNTVKAVAAKAYGECPEVPRRVRRHAYDQKQVILQAIGCGMSALASAGFKPLSARDLKAALCRVVEKGVDMAGYGRLLERYEGRRTAKEARTCIPPVHSGEIFGNAPWPALVGS